MNPCGKKLRHWCLRLCLLALPAFLGAQEFALVLAGGGGKGAYQVGVWKALSEYGIAQRVTVMSGTSVGGLNAALFACCGLEDCEDIWRTAVPPALTQDGLISQRGLLSVIERVPLLALQADGAPHVIVTAVRKRLALAKLIFRGDYAHRFLVNAEDSLAEMRNELLATAAFPVICSPVRLKDGYDYIDGGAEMLGGDNVPIAPVAEQYARIRTIIVVYLQDAGNLTGRIRQIDYDDRTVIEIIPSIDLGNLLEGTTNFTETRIDLLIRTGYEDACTVLERHGYTRVSSYWFTMEEEADGL